MERGGERMGRSDAILLCAVAAVPFIVLGGIAIGVDGLTSNSAAAWVQAVGSIGAIIATGVGVHWSHSLSMRRTGEERVLQALEKKRLIRVYLMDLEKTANGLAQRSYVTFSRNIGEVLVADWEAVGGALGRIDSSMLSAQDAMAATVGEAVAKKLVAETQGLIQSHSLLDEMHLRRSGSAMARVLRKHIQLVDESIAELERTVHVATSGN